MWEYIVLRIWEASGLTAYDRATLSASFYYHWDDRLNCERALQVLMKRTTGAEQAEKLIRTRFGCDSIADKPRVVIDGIGFHSCLCRYQNPLFYPYLDLAARMDAGILPDRGAYLDQPAKTLEAIQLLTHLRAEAHAADAAKESKAHGRK